MRRQGQGGGSELEPCFSMCGLWRLWRLYIRHPEYQIFTLYITVAKLQLSKWHWNNFMVGVAATWGTVLKGCSIRKIENHWTIRNKLKCRPSFYQLLVELWCPQTLVCSFGNVEGSNGSLLICFGDLLFCDFFFPPRCCVLFFSVCFWVWCLNGWCVHGVCTHRTTVLKKHAVPSAAQRGRCIPTVLLRRAASTTLSFRPKVNGMLGGLYPVRGEKYGGMEHTSL